MAPIEMTFGQTKYKVQPLRLGAAREWREQLNDTMAPLAETFQSSIVGGGAVSQGLAQMLLQFPDKMLALILAYGPDLPKETIVAEATEEQLITAWNELLAVAFPFVGPLALMLKVIRPTR